jgi:hypothetical protein
MLPLSKNEANALFIVVRHVVGSVVEPGKSANETTAVSVVAPSRWVPPVHRFYHESLWRSFFEGFAGKT